MRTNRSRWWEGQNTGDVVPEVRVHVGVVHPVVQTRVGHGDDDARAVKSRPRRVDVGHVRAAPRVVDMHDLYTDGIEYLVNRTGFDPFNGSLLQQPAKA